MRDEVKKYLESRMLGNLHVRFGVGVRARFPGLHHDAKTESKTDSVTTSTTLDSVLVDGILAAEWIIHARSTVSNTNIWAGKVLAIHNGTASGDATEVDYNSFAVLKTGSAIPSLDFEVVLSGAGVSQEMQLKASSSQAVNIRISRSLLNEQ